jgi:WD40 repeat protein
VSCYLRFQGHKKWITAVSWEPAHLQSPSRRFASASKDGDIRIWDTTLHKTVMCLTGHTLAVTCVKWGGEGFIYSRYTPDVISPDLAVKVLLQLMLQQIKSNDMFMISMQFSRLHY